jgi:serine phosphatase RsbU (regulator of sigma subunit)
MVIVFSLLLFRQSRARKIANLMLARQNVEIQQKNEEISAQRDEIESQRDEIITQRDLVFMQKEQIEVIHKKVTDSINYAKRIQEAVLPGGETSRNLLGDHFILFMPKDIVSGDFYWGTRINNWLIVTVADCTGHGVPGAFMSMLGISFLNEIVRKKEITSTSEVLDNLRESIIEALQQKGQSGEQKDGMDIALCAIQTDADSESGGYLLQYSGANNPLYIVNADAGIIEIEPDKQPVSIYEKMKPFTNHILRVKKGDMLYLTSDGYADQFCSHSAPSGSRKFKTKQLKELFVRVFEKPVEEQQAILNLTFEKWRGSGPEKHDQIDDVTILGLRIP